MLQGLSLDMRTSAAILSGYSPSPGGCAMGSGRPRAQFWGAFLRLRSGPRALTVLARHFRGRPLGGPGMTYPLTVSLRCTHGWGAWLSMGSDMNAVPEDSKYRRPWYAVTALFLVLFLSVVMVILPRSGRRALPTRTAQENGRAPADPSPDWTVSRSPPHTDQEISRGWRS